MSTDNAFAGIEPAGLWRHFEALTRIPRPSKREAAAVEHVMNWAREKGWTPRRDAVGNVCVPVPATPGCEKAPVVVLQSHLDMVCERDSNSPYDPDKGLIHAVREGDWIRSEGTTLGADNGIGVAAMMYTAESGKGPRGPLDLLFTIDEETGLTGAAGMDPAMLRGRVLLNLDSEEDGILTVGCAGGCDTHLEWTGETAPAPGGWTGLSVAVSGLQGGHSGVDINLGRLNAIKALVRMLEAARGAGSLRLAAIRGGNKHNAIPREASADILVPGDKAPAIRAAIDEARAALARQFAGSDGGLAVTVAPAAGQPGPAWTDEAGRALLDLLHALPAGVLAMSQDIPGLVETSSNLAVVGTDGARVKICCSSRSSVAGALRDVLDSIQSIGRLAGVGIKEGDGYPGWKPNPASPLLGVCQRVYQRMFGSEPQVSAIHAGLECGLLGERVAGMDMISLGPEIKGVHAPGERVQVSSVEKFCRYLDGILAELAGAKA
jgi:dipeptidase D